MTTDHLEPKQFFSQGSFLDAATAIVDNCATRWQLALQSIDDVDRFSFKGVTLLVFAIFRVNLSAVEALVARGANVNLPASGGMTPLKAAAMVGSQEILRVLLEKSADPNVADGDGFTPLHFATQQAIIEAAKSNSDSENTSRIELLLRFGAHVDAQNHFGITPLMMACEMGGGSCALLLIRAGADPDLKDLTGLTARQLSRPWEFSQKIFTQNN